MRILLVLIFTGSIMIGSNKSLAQTTKRKKTPHQMVMSQEEKTSVNYDARENHRIINENIKHKEANKKAADKQRKKQIEALNTLNSTSSKTKKRKSHEAFGFY